VEALLIDACTIYSDPEGTADDEFDTATGTYVLNPTDSTAVWSGSCAVLNQAGSTPAPADGAVTSTEAPAPGYAVLLPLAAPILVAANVLVVTTSRLDASLVGRRFRLDQDSPVMTFAVVRRVPVTIEPVP